MKSILFVASVLVFGCSSLPRSGTGPVTINTVRPEQRPGALASGPAFLHLNTEGHGTLTVYLADDSGVAGDSCPSALADHATTLVVLNDEAHVSDIPVPGGKRACAVFDPSSEMSLNWLAEDYRKSAPAEGGRVEAMMLAKR